MRAVAAIRDAAFAGALVAAAYLVLHTAVSYGSAPPSPRGVTAVASPARPALLPGDSVPIQVTVRNGTRRPFDLDPRLLVGRVSSLPRGCRASWFTFAVEARRAIVVGRDGGTAQVAARLRFVDTDTDQSACAGAGLALSLSVRRPPLLPS